MLQNESLVIIADNTWAKKGKIFRILKWSNARSASVGDRVVLAIKESSPTGSVKKWEVAQGIIVRTRKEIRRADGTYVRFADNAVVLVSVNDKWEIAPIGKRVFGPVAREIREHFRVITNMAEEVI